MFYPTTDQSANSFDEFFNKELYASSEDNPIKPEDTEDSPGTSAFDLATKYESTFTVDRHSESPPQPWRKGVWCMNEKASPRLVVGKTRKTNTTPPSNISPAHLVVNDNYALRSPRSITQSYDTKDCSPSRLRQMHCLDSGRRQRPPRDMTQSPSPMYPRSFGDDRNGYVDAWQQDFHEFNLQLNDNTSELAAFSFNQFNENDHSLVYHRRAQMPDGRVKTDQRSATMHHFGAANQRHDPHHAAHDLSSLLNANLNAAAHNTFSSSSDRVDMGFRFVSEDVPSMTDWTTESLHSSNSSHNSHFSHNSRDSQPPNMYNTTVQPQNWWSPPLGYGQSHLAQASRDNYPALLQPKPRRATHRVLGHDADQEDYLDNDYPSSEEIGIALPYRPPQVQLSTMEPKHEYINPLASYPPLPPPVDHNFPDVSPFRTPRRSRAPTRTPSPPISPTHRQPRSLKQRSPSRRDASQHRRKSIHKAGPIKGAETPRHRSTSRPPRTPKTPKTPHDSFGQIGFVNFTPKDASKLLNDVAPSGSSKTRARREQEAREKRKKLSEAALNAVRDAGGDVEALERAIST